MTIRLFREKGEVRLYSNGACIGTWDPVNGLSESISRARARIAHRCLLFSTNPIQYMASIELPPEKEQTGMTTEEKLRAQSALNRGQCYAITPVRLRPQYHIAIYTEGGEVNSPPKGTANATDWKVHKSKITGSGAVIIIWERHEQVDIA